jgi:hypothetical protein
MKMSNLSLIGKQTDAYELAVKLMGAKNTAGVKDMPTPLLILRVFAEPRLQIPNRESTQTKINSSPAVLLSGNSFLYSKVLVEYTWYLLGLR